MRAVGRLGAMRARAESMMLDAGRAERPSGEPTYNPATQTTTQATTPLFTSPCKVQARALVAREAEVGGRTSTSVRTELHLPVDTAPLTTDDVWVMTDVAAGSLSVAGQRLRVVAPVAGTFKTARRYEVVEVVT